VNGDVGVISGVAGGLGLFLLGMLLLTENLRLVASDSMSRAIKRFTNTRLSGILTGTAITAVLQSSTATTLITVGLVGSGVLSFPRSLGVIYGANIGTTSTTWIVALVGLKVSMTTLSLPLLGLGALLRLFARGPWRHVGLMIAGFAMIFLGIDFLQLSMADFGERIDPATLARPGLSGTLLMVLLGVVMTIVMQSSSAAAAVTLTLLHAGALSLPLAAAAVIGQNIGTTFTAALGAIGSSVHAKRTALAHTLFNVVTALVALAILPAFVAWVDRLADDVDTVALAVFQTAFNLLGVLLFFPVTTRFAAWVERLLPEPRPLDGFPTLDRHAVTGQEAAVSGARLAARRLSDETARLAQLATVGSAPEDLDRRVSTLRTALGETIRYLRAAPVQPESVATYAQRLAITHALDHLDQLTGHLALAPAPAAPALPADLLRACSALFAVSRDVTRLEAAPDPDGAGRTARAYDEVRTAREAARREILEQLALGVVEPEAAAHALERVRWLDDVARHAWRTAHYLAEAPLPLSTVGVPVDDEITRPIGERAAREVVG
jgi:phosphate:Na+ symporter